MFVFVIVLSILCSKLIYNNFSQNSPIDNINTTTDNTNIVAQSIGNSKDQTYNNINNQVRSEEHKFDKVALLMTILVFPCYITILLLNLLIMK